MATEQRANPRIGARRYLRELVRFVTFPPESLAMSFAEGEQRRNNRSCGSTTLVARFAYGTVPVGAELFGAVGVVGSGGGVVATGVGANPRARIAAVSSSSYLPARTAWSRSQAASYASLSQARGVRWRSHAW